MDMRSSIGHVEQRQKSRSMPCGSRRQLIAFYEHSVPATFPQMVGNGCTNCATTNNQSFHLRLHRERLLYTLRVHCPKSAQKRKNCRPTSYKNRPWNIFQLCKVKVRHSWIECPRPQCADSDDRHAPAANVCLTAIACTLVSLSIADTHPSKFIPLGGEHRTLTLVWQIGITSINLRKFGILFARASTFMRAVCF